VGVSFCASMSDWGNVMRELQLDFSTGSAVRYNIYGRKLNHGLDPAKPAFRKAKKKVKQNEKQ